MTRSASKPRGVSIATAIFCSAAPLAGLLSARPIMLAPTDAGAACMGSGGALIAGALPGSPGAADEGPDPVLTPPHDLLVTSSAFEGARPAREGIGSRPIADLPGRALEGEVVHVGRGCIGDIYLDDPAGKIALIERGHCFFTEKFQRASASGAAGVIVYDFSGDTLTGMLLGEPPIDLAGVFVWRSTGLDLAAGAPPVTVRIEPAGVEHLPEYLDEAVQTLFDEGLLNNGQLTSLLKKLELAQRQIDKGNIKGGIAMLETFITQVQELVDQGAIAPEDGDVLIEAAQALIDSLAP